MNLHREPLNQRFVDTVDKHDLWPLFGIDLVNFDPSVAVCDHISVHLLHFFHAFPRYYRFKAWRTPRYFPLPSMLQYERVFPTERPVPR